MKYCVNCGAQLNDYADFCTKCGTRINYSAGTQRDVRFAGSVIKCACCGEILNSGDIKCPKCKYEIRNGNVSKAVGDFFREYRRISEQRTNNNGSTIDRQLADYIKSVPIPNNKEDIIEFFYQAYSHLDVEIIYDKSANRNLRLSLTEYKSQRDIAQSWEEKLISAYQKAERYCKTEQQFLDISHKYKEYQSRKHKFKKTANFYKSIAVIMAMIPVISAFAIVYFCFSLVSPKTNNNANNKESNSNIEEAYSNYVIQRDQKKLEEKETIGINSKDFPKKFVEGYEKAEYSKFNSYASENGLGDSKIYIYGTIDMTDYLKIFDDDEVYAILGYVTDDSDNKWIVVLNYYVPGHSENPFEKYVGEKVLIRGIYTGYSDKVNRPAIDLDKLIVLSDGEILDGVTLEN